jgi:hypothetical protein
LEFVFDTGGADQGEIALNLLGFEGGDVFVDGVGFVGEPE